MKRHRTQTKRWKRKAIVAPSDNMKNNHPLRTSGYSSTAGNPFAIGGIFAAVMNAIFRKKANARSNVR